jgi:hypothetical protein
MRLINVKKKNHCIFRSFGTGISRHNAILSHTLGAMMKVSFQDIQTGDLVFYRSKEGFNKIKYSCRQALKDGLDWIWVDTACNYLVMSTVPTIPYKIGGYIAALIDGSYPWPSKVRNLRAYSVTL